MTICYSLGNLTIVEVMLARYVVMTENIGNGGDVALMADNVIYGHTIDIEANEDAGQIWY